MGRIPPGGRRSADSLRLLGLHRGGLLERRALDVEIGQDTAQPGREPPSVSSGEGEDCRYHVHSGVDVLHPVDGDLVDAQAIVLGEQQQ